jgi:hypothetical protein
MAQAQEKKMLFKVFRGGDLVGWSEVGVVFGEDTLFAVSVFHEGAMKPAKKQKASHRSYQEMTKDGVLKRFKRWASVGKREDYWMVFYYQGVLKIRFERGSPDRAKVRDLGKIADARPLGQREPHLAWVLINFGNKRETTCVSVEPDAVGKAKVEMLKSEAISLSSGSKTEVEWWEVKGDCGSYTVLLDKKTKEPLVLEAGGLRYERVMD